MNFVYNIALYLGFLLLTPRFLFDSLTGGKWAAGFRQRLGNVPAFDANGRGVVLLHCVSVGEANAALPMAKRLKRRFPDLALVVSTTTRTGQQVARESYADLADLVVYFPFDLEWTVRRFLRRIRPDLVLLTETELWYNFIRTASKVGIPVAIVNGRLSERSFRRYSLVKRFMKRLLSHVDLLLMQGDADAERIRSLGARDGSVIVTGNLKFDIDLPAGETDLGREFRKRFGVENARPLIIAASTHEPEERLLLDAFGKVRARIDAAVRPRLMIVPRHPERFDAVADLIGRSGLSFVRRSTKASDGDTAADIILLDSVGELGRAYPLADLVFVGGSLIPHGGQSVFEPAAEGKPIVTGPYTSNFAAAVQEFIAHDGIIQLKEPTVEALEVAFNQLLSDADRRIDLGRNARAVMDANRGAVERTLDQLEPLIPSRR